MSQHWTDATDAEADVFYATLTIPQIRVRQDLCAAQIRVAFDQGNDRALTDLRHMEDALTRALLVRP